MSGDLLFLLTYKSATDVYKKFHVRKWPESAYENDIVMLLRDEEHE
jgi:hypothetical protein